MGSIARLDLSPGKYVIFANASFSDNSGNFRAVRCILGDEVNTDFGKRSSTWRMSRSRAQAGSLSR